MKKLVFKKENNDEKLFIYDVSYHLDPSYYSIDASIYLIYYENLKDNYFEYFLLTESETINEKKLKRLFDGHSGDSFNRS